MNTANAAFWGLACAAALAIHAPTPARAASDQGACAVIASPFSLAEIIDQALVAVPGTVAKAGFVVLRDPDAGPVTLFQVKIRSEAGDVAHLFFDVQTGAPVEPPEPVFSLREAYDLAVAAVEAASTSEGDAVVLKGRLAHPLLAPTYVFAIVDPDEQLALAHVDAQSGEVELFSQGQIASGEPNQRLRRMLARRHGRRHVFQCESLEPDPGEGLAEEAAQS